MWANRPGTPNRRYAGGPRGHPARGGGKPRWRPTVGKRMLGFVLARRATPVIALTLVMALSTACARGAGRHADERAHRAGVVMGRVNGTPLHMAARVVGQGGGGSIDVLVAERTERSGRIVLRIREYVQESFDSQTSVRCYEYTLDVAGHPGEPRRIDCPDLPPLDLPNQSPPTTIDGG
jgi:hypothetical protein